MKLYLVQHGEARSKADDPQRPLTERGREDVARVAVFAANTGCQVRQIRHSDKRRAEETASILAEHLSPAEGMVAIPGLAPKDDVRSTAATLQNETRPVMLVGHLPFLEHLASLLVTGDPDRSIVRFQMGGIVCLVREEKSWTVGWMVTPDLIP
ncbi:MAG: phosphohistidine phosphatase SixA [Chloroflexota bacterium]|nr:phosphohistidine phosphatase SixA [Chloroflexota bacterium]